MKIDMPDRDFVEKLEEIRDIAERIADMSSVDHPEHYNRNIECIDEMIAVFGKEVVMNFCLCNVWKYRYRASDKNGEEDIEKSDWYMNKYMELKQCKDSK